MKIKTICVLLSLLAVAAFSNKAHAALINVNLGSGVYYDLGGAVVPGNVDLQSLRANRTVFANYNVSGVHLRVRGAGIVTGNDPNGLFAHVMPSGIGNNTHYLAVFGHSPFFTGRATFDLGAGYNTFAFNWGSIDTYNRLTFLDGNNHTYTITGADILHYVTGLTPGRSSEYISITDLAGIKRVILSSTRNAFEVANINISAVPLPAALPMFGMALLGLYGVKRRKAQKAKA